MKRGFPDVGYKTYAFFIRRKIEEFECEEDFDNQSPFVAYMDYLEMYNTCLILFEDSLASDAYKHMTNQIEKIKPVDGGNTSVVDEELYLQFKELQDELERLSKDDKNPKLECMKNWILKQLTGEDDTAQAMVMVQSRHLTEAIEQYLSEDKDMLDEGIEIGRLVGSNAKISESGMSTSEWIAVVEGFKAGDIKVLVCTNVAEEGLDIPKCSLIINYERTQDEIGMVQLSGRARAQTSFIVNLTARESIHIRDRVAVEKVKLMHHITEEIYNIPTEDMRQALQHLQRDILEEENQFQAEMKLKQQSKDDDSGYKFLCGKCRAFVCNASDVREYEMHRVVVDKTIFDRAIEQKASRNVGVEMQGKFKKAMKLYCKNCSTKDWGIKAVYNKVPAAYLKSDRVLKLQDPQGEVKFVKGWGKLPCRIKTITFSELLALLSE